MSNDELIPIGLSFPIVKNHQSIHSIWKFPGSFHPPVCDWIINNLTKKTDIILDPMCGSGVLPIQAYINHRISFGIDIDPFSILMCKAKVKKYDLSLLKNDVNYVLTELEKIKRDENELNKLVINDEEEITESIPKIFNDSYWFKKYILNDLGKTLAIINKLKENKIFFQSCLGSITRIVSNADPVPISGLEITSHAKKRNKKRKIDFVGQYQKKLEGSFRIIQDFNCSYNSISRPKFFNADIRTINKIKINPNTIIFSPPYCNAIEYYRRHRLEYMLLGLLDKDGILDKSRLFIGSTTILMKEESAINEKINKLKKIKEKTGKIKNRLTRTYVEKYFVDTNQYLFDLHSFLRKNGKLAIIVGDSVCGGIKIPTGEFLLNLAKDIGFSPEEVYEYPIKNKRMNYTRRNRANIKTEKILFLRKR